MSPSHSDAAGSCQAGLRLGTTLSRHTSAIGQWGGGPGEWDELLPLSACLLVAQSCPTLGDPMDCSLPVSSVHEFSMHEYWSGLPFPSPGDLLDPGIKPGPPALQADGLSSEPPGKPNNIVLNNLH